MAATLDILDRLVGFETVSTRSNLALIDYVQDYLSTRGFRVLRVPDATGQKAGLIASIGPDGAGVVLSAHSDVVPVEGQVWTREPFRLSRAGDRLYGRGTTDMKGFLAAMLVAADGASRLPLTEPLKLVISYDEEIGCVGLQQMLPAIGAVLGRPRACIVGEPTGMQVAIGHKGKASFRATCTGQAGHSALAPRFVNALHLASDFVQGLRGLQDDLEVNGAQDAAFAVPFSTVHVGTLAGGTALNIVPDTATLAFEVRHLAEDDLERLTARIDAEAQRIAQSYRGRFPDASIRVERTGAYPGLDTAPQAEVTALVQSLAGTDTTTKVAFGTEAGFFAALGIPTIVCGPGDMAGQGHMPDEFIDASQLAACDAMLARLLDTLCCPTGKRLVPA
jgi:acetylornithine deacetylase